MRLSAHGGVAPRKRDYTSIFMKINACIKPAQNAHILACMLRFFAVSRLAMNPDPHFLDRFKPDLITRKISGLVKWYLRILLAGSSMGSGFWVKKGSLFNIESAAGGFDVLRFNTGLKWNNHRIKCRKELFDGPANLTFSRILLRSYPPDPQQRAWFRRST
jgi:hypothetical protein